MAFSLSLSFPPFSGLVCLSVAFISFCHGSVSGKKEPAVKRKRSKTRSPNAQYGKFVSFIPHKSLCARECVWMCACVCVFVLVGDFVQNIFANLIRFTRQKLSERSLSNKPTAFVCTQQHTTARERERESEREALVCLFDKT